MCSSLPDDASSAQTAFFKEHPQNSMLEYGDGRRSANGHNHTLKDCKKVLPGFLAIGDLHVRHAEPERRRGKGGKIMQRC